MQDRAFKLLPYVGLALAAALVLVLAVQKRALIEQVETTERRLIRATREVAPGTYLPTFQAQTLDGATVRIGEQAARGKQVLLVYTTTCGFCKASLPAWKQLAAFADTFAGTPTAVYGVSLDSVEVTRKYAAENALPFPTIRFPDVRHEAMYRAASVPLVLVLNEEGRTVYSRLGQLSTPAAVDSVKAAIRWEPAPAAPAPAAPAPAAPAPAAR